MTTNSKSFLKICLSLLMSCLLASCDGGIFGTGAGDDNIALTLPETDGNLSQTSDNTADIQTLSHENQTISTTSDSPNINIINASDRAISIVNDTDGSFLFPSPIGAGTFSMTSILFFNNASMGLDASILNTQSFNPSSTTALVRIIQGETLTSENISVTFTLTPEGNNPGSTAVDFTNVSATTRSEANYQIVGAGDYVVVDPLNRIPRLALSVENGRVYTLIVQFSDGGDLLIHEDSRFEF